MKKLYVKKFGDFLNEEIGSGLLDGNMDGYIIGKLFQSRDIAHLNHLATESYAEHKALNEYYDGILDLTDRFAEAYQGTYGKVEITIPSSQVMDINQHLTELKDDLNSYRAGYTDQTDLETIIDEMVELISTTLYKINELH